MDQSWHPEHFVCFGCLAQFTASMSYREREGKPYCDHCYTDTVLPKCGGCGEPITDREDRLYCDQCYKEQFVPRCAKCQDFITSDCIRAMDQSWHPEHFVCFGCLAQFTASMSYREREGKPYCDHCYTDTVLPKCGGCGEPITDRALRAFDKQWHIKCFVCSECKKTFEGSQNFYSIENQPVCGPCAGVNEDE